MSFFKTKFVRYPGSINKLLVGLGISLEDALSFDGEGNELHLEDILGTEDDIVPKTFEKRMDKETTYKRLREIM